MAVAAATECIRPRRLFSCSQMFFNNDTFELMCASAGALLFCFFIIYDTHLLMRRLSPEEYLLAAINLYLDVINLFLETLRILSKLNERR